MAEGNIRLALFEPDIPQNTGTLLRAAACLGVAVDIVGPTGFAWSDSRLRRAGMDYLEGVDVTRHDSWARFCERLANRRLILLTTKGDVRHVDFRFAPGDVLLAGRESAGAPDDVHARADARLRIPMAEGRRSLNVAVAAVMVLNEALRQTNGFAP